MRGLYFYSFIRNENYYFIISHISILFYILKRFLNYFNTFY